MIGRSAETKSIQTKGRCVVIQEFRRCVSMTAVTLTLLMAWGCALTPSPAGDEHDGDNDGNGANNASLAVFQDPDSSFSTTDVYDVDDQIVRFDTETKSIIWAEDGRAYQAGLWEVNGNFPEATGFFQVRFGTKDGERRAYFTETATATICDIRVSDDTLSIFATTIPVPQE